MKSRALVAGLGLALSVGTTLAPAVAHAQQGPAPPPPMGPNVQGANTEEERRRRETMEALETAHQEDSGRGASFLYAFAGGGGGYLNLTGFSNSASGLTQPDGGAGLAELGAGVRLIALTVGARARWAGSPGFNLWHVMADVAFHLPGKNVDSFFGLHAGYVFTGNVDTSGVTTVSTDDLKNLQLKGFVGGVDVGGDYFLLPILSLGAVASFDTYLMSRSELTTVGGAPVPDPDLARSGSSAGYGITGALRVGLHL